MIPSLSLSWAAGECFVAQQVFLTRHQYGYRSIATRPTRSAIVDEFRVRVDASLRSYD